MNDRRVDKCWKAEVAAVAGYNADQYNGCKTFAQQLGIFRNRRPPSEHFQCDKLPMGDVDEERLALMDKRCAKVGSKRKYTAPLSKGKLSESKLSTYVNKRAKTYREALGAQDDDMESPPPNTMVVTKKRKNNSKEAEADKTNAKIQKQEIEDALWEQLANIEASA